MAGPRKRIGRPLPLRGDRSFARVFAGGTRARTRLARAIAAPNGLAVPRLGMITPKRRVRRAVDRNRLRRLIRESVASHHHMLKGMDLVVTTEAGAAAADNAALRAELARLWTTLLQRCGNDAC
mgnify:CR=1 FL=1